MAEPEAPDADAQDAPPPSGLLGRARAWSAGHPRRVTAIGVALVVVAIATVGAWLTLAEIAAGPEQPTIELALRALDEGDDELASGMVAQIPQASLKQGQLGGPLFVLGVIETRHAERQWSAERRQREFFVASKYLSEARTLGFPEGREPEGLYLLGKSLIESRQLTKGVEVLLEALAVGAQNPAEVHRLLGEAHYFASAPRYELAVEHLQKALEDASFDPELRAETALLLTEALAALGRLDEASATLGEASDAGDPARRKLVEGKLLLSRLDGMSPAPEAANDRRSLAEQATEALQQARRLDKLSTSIGREGEYFVARVKQNVGAEEEALDAYESLRRNQGGTPAGIAAALAEGKLRLSRREPEAAVGAFRRALDALADPNDYRGTIMPLTAVRDRLRDARNGFVDAGYFAEAETLVDHLTPLFSRTEQLSLRAATLEAWGGALLERAEGDASGNYRRRGLQRLREAAMAYEQLAEARFATRQFVDDLWRAAETYSRGQSYSSAVRVLDRYLRHEPEVRNALALLRLGEAHLSLGKPNAAIDTLMECLEMHPEDGSSYRARVECAEAFQQIGDFDQAEMLLRDNLTGFSLTPRSPEWRDSLFALGRVLVDEHRYDEAIATLGEAIDRYPDDPQQRLAKYFIAEAHRHAAAKPLSELAVAKTVNERERAREEADAHLQEALMHYEQLQRQITLEESQDELDRVTLRNCYMLGGSVQFELGRYEDAIASFSSISTLYQNEPFLLEAIVRISHCWRRLKDNVRAAGAVQQAKDLLARLPDDADFATSTTLSRLEWGELLEELAQF